MAWFEVLVLALAIWVVLAIGVALLVGRVVADKSDAG